MAFYQRCYTYLGLDMPIGVIAPEAVWRFDGGDQRVIDRTGHGHNLDQGNTPTVWTANTEGLRGLSIASNSSVIANGQGASFPNDSNPEALRIAKTVTGAGDASMTLEVIVKITGKYVTNPVVCSMWRVGGVFPPGTANNNFLWDLRTNGLGGNWQWYYQYGTGGSWGQNTIDFGTNEKSRDTTVLVTVTQSADGQTRKLYLDGVLKSTVTAHRAEKADVGNSQQLIFGGNWTFETMVGLGFSMRITAQTMTDDQVKQVADSVIGGRVVPLGPLWSKNSFDSDGRRLMDGTQLTDLQHIKSDSGSFWTGISHYGADHTGQLRYNGTACGFGDFGTVSGGLRKTAWANDQNPMAAHATMPGAMTFPVDGRVRFVSAGTPSGTQQRLSSLLRWYILPGNFDFQIPYYSFSPSATGDFYALLYLFANNAGSEGSNGLRLVRERVGGVNQYDRSVFQNGVFGNQTLVATADTSGWLRIVRTGWPSAPVISFYAGATQTPTTPIGTSLSGLSLGDGSLFCFLQLSNGGSTTTGSVDWGPPVLSVGSTSSIIGWARNANPDSRRGILGPMPTDLLATVHGDEISTAIGFTDVQDMDHGGVELIDRATGKLWMGFHGKPNNAIHNTSTSYNVERPQRIAWNDGLLLIAQARYDAIDQGNGYVIDFTTGLIRTATGSTGSPVPGGVYGGSQERAADSIVRRNDALAYGAGHASWATQTNDVYDVAVYRSGGYEYRAFATGSGVTIQRQQRWYNIGTNIQTGAGQTDWAISTQTGVMRVVKFDQSTGRLFYATSTTLYASDAATWQSPTNWSGGTFGSTATQLLPGTISREVGQLKLDIIGTDLYVARDEGVYWESPYQTSGTFVLAYTTEFNPGLHQILPDNDRVTCIAVDDPMLAVAMSKNFEQPATVFYDDFSNGTVDLLTDLTTGGTITEGGSELTIGISTGSPTGHWPIAYQRTTTVYPLPSGLIRFETRLEQATRSAVNMSAGMLIGSSRGFELHFGFTDIGTLTIMLEGAFRSTYKTSIANSSTVTAPGTGSSAHVYRVYWNPQIYPIAIQNGTAIVEPKSLSFWYSVDNGATWVVLHSPINGRYADFTVDWFGCYARTWSTNPSVTAKFSYLKMEDFGLSMASGLTCIIDTTLNAKVQQNETQGNLLTEPLLVTL